MCCRRCRNVDGETLRDKKKIVNFRRVKVSLTPVHRLVRRLVGLSTTTFSFDLLGATYAVQADCFTASLPSENVT